MNCPPDHRILSDLHVDTNRGALGGTNAMRRGILLVLSLLIVALATPATPQPVSGFDHRHTAWTTLLKQNVVMGADGNTSRLRYAALRLQRGSLKAYLDSLSAVPASVYDGWTRTQQLAFLINAYNAFTVELVLTRYPDLKSIKDIGSLLQSPWKKSFFRLLDKDRSFDEVEHELIRAPGVFDDPRIHVAVVCASIGCPMLRNEAYVADQLDAQFDDSMRRFLSDRSRNRFDAAGGTLTVSKIFDWYRKDFEQGHKGISSLQGLFARYAELLSAAGPAQADIRAGRYRLTYGEYDWALNDAR